MNATVLIHWSESRRWVLQQTAAGVLAACPPACVGQSSSAPTWPQLHVLTEAHPAPAATLLVPATDDYSGLGLRPVTLDWGSAVNLIDMPEGSTLAFDGINSKSAQAAARPCFQCRHMLMCMPMCMRAASRAVDCRGLHCCRASCSQQEKNLWWVLRCRPRQLL